MFRICLILLCLILLPSCNSQKPATTAANGNKTESKLSDEVTLTVVRNSPDADSIVERTANPTPEKIGEVFDSIDWDDPEQGSGISLSQSEPHNLSLGFKRHSEMGLMLLFSEQPEPDGKWTHQYAESVPKEDALKALQSFVDGSSQFRTLIDWKEEE